MPAIISTFAIPVTVIIPALNEERLIGETIASVRLHLPGARILVVDGGSSDSTLAVAEMAGAEIVGSGRGRGLQCHLGAGLATDPWLLFLHADTRLGNDARRAVDTFTSRQDASIGTFRLRFDRAGWFLRLSCWFTRFDSVFTRFGDQGILIRRSFYDEIGGFPPWPLFEDVALLQCARKRARIHSLPAEVITSARRFEHRGHFQQQWLNARLLLRYLCGASPTALAALYRANPSRQKQSLKTSLAPAIDSIFSPKQPPNLGLNRDAAQPPEQSMRVRQIEENR